VLQKADFDKEWVHRYRFAGCSDFLAAWRLLVHAAALNEVARVFHFPPLGHSLWHTLGHEKAR
jgi:hypothetical protein